MALVQVSEDLPAACRVISAGARAEDVLSERLYLDSFYSTNSQPCITGTGASVVFTSRSPGPKEKGPGLLSSL